MRECVRSGCRNAPKQEDIDAIYASAVALRPSHAVLTEAAQWYIQTQRPDKAEECLRKAIQAAGDDQAKVRGTTRQLIELLVNLHSVERREEVDKLIADYIAANPDDRTAPLLQAEVYMSTGREEFGHRRVDSLHPDQPRRSGGAVPRGYR